MLFSVFCGAMRMLLERFLFGIERGERLSDFPLFPSLCRSCGPSAWKFNLVLCYLSPRWSFSPSLTLSCSFSLLPAFSCSLLSGLSHLLSLCLFLSTSLSLSALATQMAEGRVLIREKFHCLTHMYVYLRRTHASYMLMYVNCKVCNFCCRTLTRLLIIKVCHLLLEVLWF